MSEFDRYRKPLKVAGKTFQYFSLEECEREEFDGLSRMPVTLKIILESVLRQADGKTITAEHLDNLRNWRTAGDLVVPFKPSRILMQDFTGVPAVVDLAVMRDALKKLGGDPKEINPLIPVDLVIDHSVQVDWYGSNRAFEHNAQVEFQRNRERYEFLRWASEAFEGFAVVPPATGICHQVNLEYLARVVGSREVDGKTVVFPDTLLGTDSHTTMINGLGVLGWGVGGIEAEAAVLGQPLFMRLPRVVGFNLTGELKAGVTATDLVLVVTQKLREYGVVGCFVEFFGSGLESLDLPDRATISNMCPEYGATAAFFPVDGITLQYLKLTGRDSSRIELVESYTRAQGMFRSADGIEPEYSDVLELDMRTVEPCIAGPRRPQDRIPLKDAAEDFTDYAGREGSPAGEGDLAAQGSTYTLRNGAVVIAAITSCTNTSNPSVMIAAGLLAKKAVQRGLRVPAYVKTSLAPGSRVVSRYLERSGLSPYLDALGFHLAGFGCTTCIGNSGPLPQEVSRVIQETGLIGVSVLSGNRNFEGRIHPEVTANYLASPPLVVAYALAGRMDIDITSHPLGHDPNGNPVYLEDIWPGRDEIKDLLEKAVGSDLFTDEYAGVYTGNQTWNLIRTGGGGLYDWSGDSTYIRQPPFFDDLTADVPDISPVSSARILALLGDSITTDHISPAGIISRGTAAALWLEDQGVSPEEFNTYGSRRGNHEVMIRGTFGNIRIRNRLVQEKEGGFTRHFPSGEEMTIFDAAEKYAGERVPLVCMAGKDYGMGSSRDWAAKGTALLGVRAVFAESFERIHRSNLIGMGVLPLQFLEGENAENLGFTGREILDIPAVTQPGQRVTVVVREGRMESFVVEARIDTPTEMEYYRNGGILKTVLRKMGKRNE